MLLSKAAGQLSVSRLELEKSWSCPWCGAPDQPEKFTDGDTVDIGDARSEDRTFDAGFVTGNCGSCNEPIYILEISHISSAPSGYSFFNDRCFTEEKKSRFCVKGSDWDWTVTRHYGVTGASFQAHDDDKKPQVLTSQDRFDWLDIHTIGPSAFDRDTDFYKKAQRLCFRLRHEISSLSLPEGA
jgi:hypothetical protein